MSIPTDSKLVRLVLRVPTEMHETIKNEARQELIPLSVWVRAVLLHVLARRKAEHGA